MNRRLLFFLAILQGVIYLSYSQSKYPETCISGDPGKPRADLLNTQASKLLLSNPDSAYKLANQAYQIVALKDDDWVKYESVKLMADANYYSGDLMNAIENYKNAAEIIRNLKGELSLEYASRTSDIGYCYNELNVFDIGIEYFQKSLEIFTKLQHKSEISNQLNNIGHAYFSKGNFNLALEYFSRSLQYDLQNNDSAALSTTYNNIGKVYETWGYYDLAIEHYLKSIGFLSENGNEAHISVRLSNIGTSWLEKGEYQKALDYLEKALQIEQKLENQYKIAIRKNEIANVLSALGQYSDAIRENQEALHILDSMGRKESMAIVLNDLGMDFMRTENQALSKKYLERSINLSREIGSIANEMKSYERLAELYQKMNNPAKAFEYYLKYDRLKDTIFNIRTHNQLANYRIRYETEKKERENQILKHDIQNKKRTQRALIIIGTLMFISILLLFFLLRLKNRTLKQDRKLYEQEKRLSSLELEKTEMEKRQLNERVFAEKQVSRLQQEKFKTEMAMKNRELVNSTIQLVNKNEVLTEIREKIKLHTTEMPQEAYNELLHLVNHNTDFDQNWKKFKVEFEKLNPGFFDRIKNNYPDFSEPFVRLSALLRIDLSTREIAQLMNVSVAAVNKNRQRLRKKLNLEPEADLVAYMKSI